MTELNSACVRITQDKQIVCRDPGTANTLTFRNPTESAVTLIQLDGCQLTQYDSRNRCDFLLIAFAREHFVELKGSNFAHAITQLTCSIEDFSRDPKRGAKYAFVKFSNRAPNTTVSQKWKEKFRVNYNAVLILMSSQQTHLLQP